MPQIARVTFTSEDRVWDVIHNFNADGFESLYPRYKGGRPPKFTEAQRDEITGIALQDRRITICRSRPGAGDRTPFVGPPRVRGWWM